MPKALLVLSLLLIVVPSALALPPEGSSSQMVYDDVGDGLRRHPREKSDWRRMAWLKTVAPKRDPRVGIALTELVFDGEGLMLRQEAAVELHVYYIRPYAPRATLSLDPRKGAALQTRVRDWWREAGGFLLLPADRIP
jgi:hypothetical protein